MDTDGYGQGGGTTNGHEWTRKKLRNHEWTRMDTKKTQNHEWTRMDTNGLNHEWTRMDTNDKDRG